jgi:mercuric ion transport protein
MKNKLLKTGIIGTVIAIVCCMTPVLVVLLGSLGLLALTGYLDILLAPILAIFLGITAYAVWKRSKS